MNEFDSCVHSIIKQIYPVLAHEYEMGLTESRSSESNGIYSFQFLRSLHENSMDNIHKILKQTISEDVKRKKEFCKSEKGILLEFFIYMNEKKSKLSQQWLSLQHHMHYLYREVTSRNPRIEDNEISDLYIVEMRNLAKSLAENDEIQLYLRVFSLIREYVTFAFWQYSKAAGQGQYIERLYLYYKAFMIATKNAFPAFASLETLLKEKCNMTWMDYNKFIFFNYFYLAIDEHIFSKLEQDNIIDITTEFNLMLIDFTELNTLWETIDTLKGVNEKDKKMNEEYKEILLKNFWVYRKVNEKGQLMQRLPAELIILASERKINSSEPILDKNGQCMCEDCLIIKLSFIIEPGDCPDPTSIRVSPCRYCFDVIKLETLHDHVVDHLKNIVATGDTKFIFNLLNVSGSKTDQDIIEREKVKESGSHDRVHIFKNLLVDKAGPKKDVLKKDYPVTTAVKDRTQSNDNPEKTDNRVPVVEVIPPNKSSCSHECAHEQDLKAELKKLGVCDHHKDSKRCDCTYCEVFGTGIASRLRKTNETRNRLRNRLKQRKQKMASKIPVAEKPSKPDEKIIPPAIITPTNSESVSQVEPQNPVKTSVVQCVPKRTLTSQVMTTDLVTSDDTTINDISGLVDYIEGNTICDKVAIAEKKAAKKARQRQKKEEEKKKLEDEQKTKDLEKKREEESKSNFQKQQDKEKTFLKDANKKQSKKQKQKDSDNMNDDSYKKSTIVEETIPATVTIKRSVENGANRPTVTITLKASTEDHDRLFYSLLQGQLNNNKENKCSLKSKKKKNTNNQPEQKAEHFVNLQVSHKDVEKGNAGKATSSVEKEVKVSFTVNNGAKNAVDKSSLADKTTNIESEKKNKKDGKKMGEIDLPFLKLPPGITITKVDGPLSNKGFSITKTENDCQPPSNVPAKSKSGVIVVDTEKLVQTNGSNNKKTKKKNKKQSASTAANNSKPSMVTLKNPIFQSLSETVKQQVQPVPLDLANSSCGQASIFRNENGMVTIRSSRLQQSLDSGVQMSNILPNIHSVSGQVADPVKATFASPDKPMSPFNAQEILSSLPGIEITKVDKKNPKSDSEINGSQVAQVSIIPTNGDTFSLEKEDWLYDNVFKPKDVLEDDLDPDELELEAFKRFCQQSVPQKQKEKVAHLNVEDIVLTKKHNFD